MKQVNTVQIRLITILQYAGEVEQLVVGSGCLLDLRVNETNRIPGVFTNVSDSVRSCHCTDALHRDEANIRYGTQVAKLFGPGWDHGFNFTFEERLDADS